MDNFNVKIKERVRKVAPCCCPPFFSFFMQNTIDYNISAKGEGEHVNLIDAY